VGVLKDKERNRFASLGIVLDPDFGRSSAAQTRKNPPRRNKKKISSSVYREQP
jgi:hypothetical protein